MAQSTTQIDALKASLKELQTTIPGVSTEVARLETLLKAAFSGGSAAALDAVTLQLGNLGAAATTAISKMSDLGAAKATWESYKTTLASVVAQIEKLKAAQAGMGAGPAGAGAGAAPIPARQAFEAEYQAGQQEAQAEIEAVQRARLEAEKGAARSVEAKAVELEKDLQAARDAAAATQRQAEAAQVTADREAQLAATKAAQIAASDAVIMRQRDMFGVGSTGTGFSYSGLTRSLIATEGGTRNLRAQMGGMDANAVFKKLLETEQIQPLLNKAGSPTGQYKFTEVTPEIARNTEALRANAAAAGAAGAAQQGYTNRITPAPVVKELTEAEQSQLALQGGGLRSLFSNDAQFAKFEQRLGQLKLGLGDVQRATTDVASGITTVSFSAFDEGTGVIRNATVYIDEFGRAVTQGTTKVKNFEEMITQNITKVFMWSIAIGAVYGSFQKIGQLVQDMQKIQQAMTDIGITTSASAVSMNSMYEVVKTIATTTKTDLVGALNSFDQALGATGSEANQLTRVETAAKLLANSLTLAKLSGLDTKTSMDTLIASLRQLDLPLSSGADLLDKFQGVANQANTSIEDMAKTFAITAGAAQDVGIGVNDLVAVIGAFGESTSLTATETGNALRAMFSNFTQPAAIQVLSKYGIAVQDINGEFRSFIDVFQEASNLARSGILNDRQVAEIANAMGGGSRRQAQVTALLTVAPRQQALKEWLDQGKDVGAVNEAMGRQTATLSSSLITLQNSFDNLAKSLGTEGGFLPALTTVVDMFAKLIDLVSQLTKAMGPGLPLLAMLGVGGALWSTQGPAIQKFAGMALGGLGSPLGGWGKAVGQTTTPSRTMIDQQGELFISPEVPPTLAAAGTQFGRNALTSFLPVVALLAGSISDAQKTGNWAGTVGMGIGGAFMAVVSGNPIWALVGALIGQAIVQGIQDQQNVIQGAVTAKASPFPTLGKNAGAPEITKAIDATVEQLNKLAGSDALNPDRWLQIRSERILGVSASDTLKTAAEGYQKLLAQGMAPEAAYAKLQATRTPVPGHEDIYSGVLGGGTFGFSRDTLDKFIQGQSILDDFLNRLLNIAKLPAEVQGGAAGNPSFGVFQQAFVGEQDRIKQMSETGQIINTPDYEYNRAKRFKLIQDLQAGDITTGEYKSSVGNLGSSGLAASLLMSAKYPKMDTANVASYKDEWMKLKDVMTIADDESHTFLTQTATDLINLKGQVEGYKKALEQNRITGLLDPKEVALLNTQIREGTDEAKLLQMQIDATTEAIIKMGEASKYSFKGFTDYSKYSQQEMSLIEDRAKALQSIYARDTGQDLAKMIGAAPELFVQTKDNFMKIDGVWSQFIESTLSKMDSFKSALESKMQFNFKSLRDVPANMAAQIQQAMNYYTNLLKKYGFNEKNEAITVLFKDNQVGQLVGSQTALQLALEDLTQVEKKKLDGVYNLPAGATAFIPLQAGKLLSEAAQNSAPTMSQTYPGTPTAPPPVGSYPLGKPPGEMSATELLKAMGMLPQTQMDKRVQDEMAKMLLREPGYYHPELPSPFNAAKTLLTGPGTTNEPTKIDNATANAAKAIFTDIQAVLKTILGVNPFNPNAKAQQAPWNPLSGLGTANDVNKVATAPPVKINITQEKQTHEVTVFMNMMLDSRRLWEGIKKIAMEDYARLTASTGDSIRSRGNIL